MAWQCKAHVLLAVFFLVMPATIGGMNTRLPWPRQHGALLSGDRQSASSQLHALHCVAIASPVETQLQLLCSAGPQQHCLLQPVLCPTFLPRCTLGLSPAGRLRIALSGQVQQMTDGVRTPAGDDHLQHGSTAKHGQLWRFHYSPADGRLR